MSGKVPYEKRFQKLKSLSLKNLKKVSKHFNLKISGYKNRLRLVCDRIEIEKEHPDKTIISVSNEQKMKLVFLILDNILKETNSKLSDLKLKDFAYYVHNRREYPDEYQEAKTIFEDLLYESIDDLKFRVMEEVLTYV